MHRIEKSEQPPSFGVKIIENQRLNWRKPANRAGHQNRKKTAVLKCENRKTEPKCGNVRKPTIPTPPSCIISLENINFPVWLGKR